MPKKLGFEGPPLPEKELKHELEPPAPEVLFSSLKKEKDESPRGGFGRKIEAPEAAKSPEIKEEDGHLRAKLDVADLESLLAVVAEAETLRRYEQEAAQTIAEYGKETPSLTESLFTPQSSDKHAEGPLMEDHLRLILVSLYAVRDGKIRLHELPEASRIVGALPKEEGKKIIGEFNRAEELIKKHPKFFEVFALYHDIAKPDTIGFSSNSGSRGEALGFVKFDSLFQAKKKMTDEETEARREAKEDYQRRLSKLYKELMLGFAERNQGLLSHPTRFQEAFYNEYGISLTHYEHGKVASMGPKQGDIRKACRRAGLREDEIELILRMIYLHIEPHTRFAEVVEPKKYGSLLKKAEGLAIDSRQVLHYVRAGALLDVLGTKKIASDGSGRLVSDLALSINFMRAELAYDDVLKEQERIVRERQIEKDAGFSAEWVISELGLKDRDIGKTLRAVRAALREGKLELPPSLLPHRAKLEEKLAEIKKHSKG